MAFLTSNAEEINLLGRDGIELTAIGDLNTTLIARGITDDYFLQGEDDYYLTDGIDEDNTSTLRIEQTFLSQYTNSNVIKNLVYTFSDGINVDSKINSFYDNIWNIDTAIGYGLDVWGKIVGVNRTLTLPPDGCWGFTEGSYQPFEFGTFYSDSLSQNNYFLDDAEYRTLILMKAACNISQVTAPVVNKILSNIFAGRGRCWVNDTGRMTMTLVFEFDLTAVERAIITQTGVIPRPAGVQLFVEELGNPGQRWGFSEGQWSTFENSNFAGELINAI